jgi:hypothetical protein
MAVAASNLAMNYEYVGQTAGSRDVGCARAYRAFC